MHCTYMRAGVWSGMVQLHFMFNISASGTSCPATISASTQALVQMSGKSAVTKMHQQHHKLVYSLLETACHVLHSSKE